MGWVVLAVLATALGGTAIAPLWHIWQSDPSLSHAPLVPLIAAGLLWSRRDQLRRWDAACIPGLFALAGTALLYVASSWADIEFLKPVAFAGVLCGAIWYLGGLSALKTAAGPLGFLAFMAPWPTSFVDRFGFPVQLISSSYAALFSGLLGLPIQREGVQLCVMPDSGHTPIYSILVAQKCSGLTSIMVLLALGYLVAMHTPVRLRWKAALLGTVLPLALLSNTVRLTVILLLGGHHHPLLAGWVHDHEGPVLMLLCSMGLIGIRGALLSLIHPQKQEEAAEVGAVPLTPG